MAEGKRWWPLSGGRMTCFGRRSAHGEDEGIDVGVIVVVEVIFIRALLLS